MCLKKGPKHAPISQFVVTDILVSEMVHEICDMHQEKFICQVKEKFIKRCQLEDRGLRGDPIREEGGILQNSSIF